MNDKKSKIIAQKNIQNSNTHEANRINL